MDAKDVIRIHPQDSDEQAKARHETIVKRLDELGPDAVRSMHAAARFPTNWDLIIGTWLGLKAK